MLKQRRTAAATWAICSMVLPCLWASSLAGSSLYVSTTGDDGNDCLSPATPCRTIQAAIDKAENGSNIDVAPGSYTERFEIIEREHLTIQGSPTANVAPPPGLPPGALVFMRGAREVRLRNLTITGDTATVGGIEIGDSSLIFIDHCTVEDSGIGGIRAFGLSSVRIEDSIIQRNNNNGIRVDAGAEVLLIGSPFSQGTSTVRQNPFTGVIVNGGTFSLQGSTLVEENSIGIMAEAGFVRSCCEAGERRIINNGTGFFIRGGHLELRGPARVAGNTQAGIEVVGGSVSFGRFSPERIIVQENGTFGILAIGSHLDLYRADVVSNTDNGIMLRDSSSAQLSDSSITGNGDAGVHIEGFSSLHVLDDVTMANNQGADLSCSSKAHAWGDRNGIRRLSCRGFERPDEVRDDD